MTEQEIWAGILTAKNPEKHSICFMRSFSDAKSNGAAAKRFFDYFPNSDQKDEEAAKLLKNLKNFLVPMKLDEKNIENFSIPFDFESGINLNLKKHEIYLKNLGDRLSEFIKFSVLEGLKEQSKFPKDPLLQEIFQHAKFSQQKCEIYCGQEILMQKILNRLSDVENFQPVILYAESGCGKTATVAK